MAELVDALVLGTSRAIGEGSSPFRPTIKLYEITIENKKGLNKDIKVVVDKKTMDTYLEERYEEVRKELYIKRF